MFLLKKTNFSCRVGALIREGALIRDGALIRRNNFLRGAYSRGALIRGWALNRGNTVFKMTDKNVNAGCDSIYYSKFYCIISVEWFQEEVINCMTI